MCCHLLKDCHLQLSLSCIINDIWTMSTRSYSLTQNLRMPSLYSECPSRHDPIALSSFIVNQPLPHLMFFSPTHFIPTCIPINLVKTPVISIMRLPRPGVISLLLQYLTSQLWQVPVITPLYLSLHSFQDTSFGWFSFLTTLSLTTVTPSPLCSVSILDLLLFSVCTLSQGHLRQLHLFVSDS